MLVINLGSFKCYIATRGIPTFGCNACSAGILSFAIVGTVLTLVTTARMAMPCMMGCQAPMSCAFCVTMRLNWVVSFHASSRISNMLLIRARRGARGNDATNRVTKPNCITVKGRGYIHRWGFHLLEISMDEHVYFIYFSCGRERQERVAEFLANLLYQKIGAQQYWKNLLGEGDRKMLQVTTHQEELFWVFKHPFLSYVFTTKTRKSNYYHLSQCCAAKPGLTIILWVFECCDKCAGHAVTERIVATNRRPASSQEASGKSWWLAEPLQSSLMQGSAVQHQNMAAVCLLGAFLGGWGKEAAILLLVQSVTCCFLLINWIEA